MLSEVTPLIPSRILMFHRSTVAEKPGRNLGVSTNPTVDVSAVSGCRSGCRPGKDRRLRRHLADPMGPMPSSRQFWSTLLPGVRLGSPAAQGCEKKSKLTTPPLKRSVTEGAR